jgi:myo-inositol-1(or 4)-monophosphatase
MHAQLNIALRAAREGAIHLARSFDRLDRVKPVSGADQRQITSAHLDIEAAVLEYLRKPYPKHGYRSAATDLNENSDADTVWFLNPLIGMQNFLRGSPGILLGLTCRTAGQTTLSVFIDPLLNEEFTAARGNGASLNGRRIRVSDRSDLSDCVIGVEYHNTPGGGDSAFSFQQQLRDKGVGQRTSGNDILDLLYVAAGRLDGGFIGKPEAGSLSGAALTLQEAGGLLSDVSGSPSLSGDSLVCGNPKCLRQLLRLSG